MSEVIDLVSVGFIRSKDEDFMDDKSSFVAFRKGNLLAFENIDDNFFSIFVGRSDFAIPRDMASRLPSHDSICRFKNVPISEVTHDALRDFGAACDKYNEEYDAAMAKLSLPTAAQLKAKADEARESMKKEIKRARLLMVKKYEALQALSEADAEKVSANLVALINNYAIYTRYVYPTYSSFEYDGCTPAGFVIGFFNQKITKSDELSEIERLLW